MKTIRQWLETLPEEVVEKALANLDSKVSDRPANTVQDALAHAFRWVRSPEGYRFWARVSDELRLGHGKPAKPLHTERERLLALACESGWHRIADSEWWLLPAQYLTEDELVRRLEREAEDPEPEALTPRQREAVAAMIREALRKAVSDEPLRLDILKVLKAVNKDGITKSKTVIAWDRLTPPTKPA